MSAAKRLAKATEAMQAGRYAKALRLAWFAVNDAMIERDPTTFAAAEQLAIRLSEVHPEARTLVTYCGGVLAQGDGEIRAENIFSRYFRRQDPRVRCPRCGESIAKAAVVCRFCGAELSERSTT